MTFLRRRSKSLCALLCISAALCWPQIVAAAQLSRVLDTEIQRSIKLPYLVHVPAQYETDKERRWPLILHLHGSSARGEEVGELRAHPLPQRLDREPEFPFIVVSPVAPVGEIWSDADTLAALLDFVQLNYRVDPDAVYVTGHGMGGRGALYLGYKFPSRFAAVVALDPSAPLPVWAAQLHKLPVWIIQGDGKEDAASAAAASELIKAIRAAGGDPRATQTRATAETYEKDEIFDWLREHRRSRSTR